MVFIGEAPPDAIKKAAAFRTAEKIFPDDQRPVTKPFYPTKDSHMPVPQSPDRGGAIARHSWRNFLVRSGCPQAAVNAGARVVATTRNRDRFAMLEELGAERCEVERRDLSKIIPEARKIDAVLDLVGNTVMLDSLAMLRRGGRSCLAGWLGGLDPIPDFNPLLQMASGVYLTFFGSFVFGTPGFPLSDVPLQQIAADAAAGRLDVKPARIFRSKISARRIASWKPTKPPEKWSWFMREPKSQARSPTDRLSCCAVDDRHPSFLSMAAKSWWRKKFASDSKLICPVQSSREKHSASVVGQISDLTPRVSRRMSDYLDCQVALA